MPSLPLDFFSEAKATKNFEEAWPISSGPMKSVCAIPPEFGGAGGGFSPEDLFLQAAINCFMGTFKVVAKLSKISFSEVHVKGKLQVGKNEDNKVAMKSIELEIHIADADRPDRMDAIVAKSIRDGFILNSVKSQVTYSLHQRTTV
jgi:organic hydroperoxide reductase OsmC/OhrA